MMRFHSRQVAQASELKRVKRASALGATVYDEILGELMSLRIPPSSRINIDTLAREMGVSQTPIREALSRLEEQGLVVKTHNVGYSAAPQIDVTRFRDLYDLRLLLEPEAAARAAERASDADIQALAELARKMDEDTQGSYSKFATLDAEFHDLILQICGNTLIYEAISRLHIHIHLFRLHYHAKVTSCALREHEALVKAFMARDPKAAREAMTNHIELSRDRFMVTFANLEV
ncbi:GntR family transcriptional regulator [Brucella intermedia]|uniref:GntR family transcriptional regulator n=1 Tax=Brucella intermedia TaxID=94625 RepID=UPI00224B5857|nr:GntR family transcriptional regulator [Brucella intermedia]